MDIDTIQGGDDFTKVIEQQISVSDVLVAVIGVHWLKVADQNGKRRLENPQDFVRLEIGKALERGIRVIPVLVGGAVIPKAEDLPKDLAAICERQAVEVRDAHFHPDADQLIEVLHKALHGVSFRPADLAERRFGPALLSGFGLLIVVLGILLFRHLHSESRAGSTLPNGNPVSAMPASVPGTSVKQADIAGKWYAAVKYDWGDSYHEVFDFEVDGSEVSGTASFLGSGQGGDRGILEGKIEGNRISFMTKSFSTISSDEKTYEDKHYYKGIVEKNAIRFTMMTDSSMESHVPIQFIASRSKGN